MFGIQRAKHRIKFADRFRQKSRTQMLVSRSHSQGLLTEQLRDGVYVGAAHPPPRRRGTPQVVKPEIDDLQVSADSPEGDAHLIRRPFREDAIARLRLFIPTDGSKHHLSHLVQVDDPAFAVLRLWKHDSAVRYVHVEMPRESVSPA
jgi:hypothetical protein